MTTQYYTVPQWAKRALGAKQARRIARQELQAAKSRGADFEKACACVDTALSEAAEHREMEEIERTAYYGLGPNPYR